MTCRSETESRVRIVAKRPYRAPDRTGVAVEFDMPHDVGLFERFFYVYLRRYLHEVDYPRTRCESQLFCGAAGLGGMTVFNVVMTRKAMMRELYWGRRMQLDADIFPDTRCCLRMSLEDGLDNLLVELIDLHRGERVRFWSFSLVELSREVRDLPRNWGRI